jgi:transcriptional regulator with XRE-family HTH domain
MKTIVGKNLKLFREAAEYKQQQVADMLGIDRGAYANYESGNREMPFKLLTEICEIYGISLSTIFEEEVATLEKDFMCAFRKSKTNNEDQKEINDFKTVVRNYMKICKLSENEAER